MSFQTIISVEDLNNNVTNENWFVFDCSVCIVIILK